MLSDVSAVQVNNYSADKKNSKNKNIGRKIAGVAAGGMICATAPLVQAPYATKVLGKMQAFNNSLTAAEAGEVSEALKKTIELSGLKNKGIEIINASAKNEQEVVGMLKKEIADNFVSRFLPKGYIDAQAEVAKTMIKNGENAAYLTKAKKILMPEGNKLSLAGFHEAGHAMNANLNTATKILQKSRKLSVLALPLIAVALLKNPKAEGEKPQGAWDKTTTFIKDHIGVLASATMLPTVAEEALATIRGNQFAKKLLSPELAKKVVKNNAYALTTYAALAALIGLGAHFGVKAKDAIVNSKKKEQNNVRCC